MTLLEYLVVFGLVSQAQDSLFEVVTELIHLENRLSVIEGWLPVSPREESSRDWVQKTGSLAAVRMYECMHRSRTVALRELIRALLDTLMQANRDLLFDIQTVNDREEQP